MQVECAVVLAERGGRLGRLGDRAAVRTEGRIDAVGVAVADEERAVQVVREPRVRRKARPRAPVAARRVIRDANLMVCVCVSSQR